MAASISFELDEITVKDIERKLGRMKSEAPKVLKNALNKTAKDARKDLAKKAQESYTAKIGGFNKQMKIKNASTGHLEAVIETHGAPLQMTYFSVRGKQQGAQLSVEIVKGSRKSMGKRAFYNKISKKSQGSANMAIAKFIGGNRAQPNRLKIQEKFSVSVPTMIGSKKRVYGILEPKIADHLKENVEKQVAKVLGS